MKPLSTILLIVVMTLGSQSLLADGNYLLQRCQLAANAQSQTIQSHQRAAISYCYGLLQGVREVNRLYESKHGDNAYFCLGETHLSHSETAKLVVDYLRQNPNKLHQNESVLAVQALRQKFPCNKTS